MTGCLLTVFVPALVLAMAAANASAQGVSPDQPTQSPPAADESRAAFHVGVQVSGGGDTSLELTRSTETTTLRPNNQNPITLTDTTVDENTEFALSQRFLAIFGGYQREVPVWQTRRLVVGGKVLMIVPTTTIDVTSPQNQNQSETETFSGGAGVGFGAEANTAVTLLRGDRFTVFGNGAFSYLYTPSPELTRGTPLSAPNTTFTSDTLKLDFSGITRFTIGGGVVRSGRFMIKVEGTVTSYDAAILAHSEGVVGSTPFIFDKREDLSPETKVGLGVTFLQSLPRGWAYSATIQQEPSPTVSVSVLYTSLRRFTNFVPTAPPPSLSYDDVFLPNLPGR